MRHTISILCDDTPGVMTRVSGLFSRRGFNIESLSVGHTELAGKSRFTIVVDGDDRVLEQVRKQLQKLVHVIKAWDIKPEDAVEREHALIKMEVEERRRAELLQIITARAGADRGLLGAGLDPGGHRRRRRRGQRLQPVLGLPHRWRPSAPARSPWSGAPGASPRRGGERRGPPGGSSAGRSPGVSATGVPLRLFFSAAIEPFIQPLAGP